MNWVATWTAAPQLTEPGNLPPAEFVDGGVAFAECTLRQTVRVSAGGPRLRLRFSNVFGATPLGLHAARVGPAPAPAPVCFGGRPSVTVAPGAQVVSDPVDFPVADRARLDVAVYLGAGQPTAGGITSHPGSRATSWINEVPVDHWYYLSGVEAWAPEAAGTFVMLGDSLTDGRGSTVNGNDRWPDQFFDLLGLDGPRSVAVANQGIGGNHVLRGGLGPSALARLDRDVLAVAGARWLLLFEGINDIGTAPAGPGIADELIFGYEQIAARAHAAGLAVYGATLTPFGGNGMYDDPDGRRDAARVAVNRWIRRAGCFDAVADFDAAVADPRHRRRLRPEADCGDHLHLNPAGYRALARALAERFPR